MPTGYKQLRVGLITMYSSISPESIPAMEVDMLGIIHTTNIY
jgi:hypothetical protein